MKQHKERDCQTLTPKEYHHRGGLINTYIKVTQSIECQSYLLDGNVVGLICRLEVEAITEMERESKQCDTNPGQVNVRRVCSP